MAILEESSEEGKYALNVSLAISKNFKSFSKKSRKSTRK
jgi:hypothetical protein